MIQKAAFQWDADFFALWWIKWFWRHAMCLCLFSKHFLQLVDSQSSDCFFFQKGIYFALKIQFIAKKPSQEQALFTSSCICWLSWGYLRHIIGIISPSINNCLWDQDGRNALPIRAYYRPDTALWLQFLVFLGSHNNIKEDKLVLEA